MVRKSCPNCDLKVPIARKECQCGFVFIANRGHKGNVVSNVIATRSANNIQPKKKLTTKRTKRHNQKRKVGRPRREIIKGSDSSYIKRIKVNVENAVKRRPGRPRKIRPEEQYVSNEASSGKSSTPRLLNISGELNDHGRESNNPHHLINDTHKRKRGRPKGSKNKYKYIYSVPTYKENKLSSPRMDKQIHLNIPKEKSSFILAEINRKIQSQYAPWKIY